MNLETHLTELGNARRLARHYGHVIKFVPGLGWMHYDGYRWHADQDGTVARYARATVAAIFEEAAEASRNGDTKDAAKLSAWATRSQSLKGLEAMTKLAQAELVVVTTADNLDQHPLLFNVKNGTINLKTGELRPHRPSDLITKVSMAEYDPAAQYGRWITFLDRIFDGNLDLIEYMQRVAGYTLTGRNSEQCLFLLWGTGENGKTTFIEVMRHVLGDYAITAPAELLMTRRTGGASPEVVRLMGSRLVTAVETDSGRRLAESLVKQLTGQDRIAARNLYKGFVEFETLHKLFLVSNHKPVITGTDHAIWRRIRLIPFTVKIQKEEKDKNLRDKLLAVAPGILNWAVEGCRYWLEGGLREPDTVLAATDAYRKEQDPLDEFIQERCEVNSAFEGVKLYTSYQEWATDNGHRPLRSNDFRELMEQKGFPRSERRTSHGVPYLGIQLRGPR